MSQTSALPPATETGWLWTTSRPLLDDALGKHGLTGVEVDFIQKPFLPRVLALKVHEILDRTRGSDA